uniref:hypothetical protein n=1 Tax=Cupriavidus plantarum TaxID=942865 RepID=UPI0038B242A3
MPTESTLAQTPEGRGYTQFGRALFKLNIDILCANSSQAKGRVERMNGTLQDRLVKELRLRGISLMGDANAYASAFIADFNARFAKIPPSDFNAHRPIHNHEDLRRIFCWRELRKGGGRISRRRNRAMGRRHLPALHHPLSLSRHRLGRDPSRTSGWAMYWGLRRRCRRYVTTGITRGRRAPGVPPGPQPVTPGVRRQRQINRLDLERAMRQSPLATVSDDDTR